MVGFRRFVECVLLLLILGAVSPAFAHANLARSEPEANAILSDSPTRLRLWFTETPEMRFSVIDLIDQKGMTVPGVGKLQVEPSDPNLLTVTLPNLSSGVYTVNWRALSAADGHTTVGAYAFAVGRDQVPASLRPFVAGSLGETSTPSIPGVTVRWLSYLTMALLMGGFAFMPLVFRPALVQKRSEKSEFTPPPRPLPRIWGGGVSGLKVPLPVYGVGGFRGWGLSQPGTSSAFSEASGLLTLLLISYGLLCAATLAGAFIQAASAQIDLIGLLSATRYGTIFWGRALLLGMLGGLFIFRRSRWWLPAWGMRFWWIGLALNGAILLTTSLSSHAAAITDSFIPVMVDWVHLAAAGVWIGGLVTLLLTLAWLWRTDRPKGGRNMALLVARFSQVATICVAVIGASGIFRAVYEVGDIGNLIDTQYGVALLAKLGLMVPIFGTAAFNLLLIQHRLSDAASTDNDGTALAPWYRLIRRTVATEISFVALILLLTGLLTSLPPAREAFGVGQVARGQVDDLRVLLAVNPGTPGLNTFDIYLKDSLNRPLPDPRKVALYVGMSGHEMPQQEAVAERIEAGHYVVRGGYASMIGTWEIEVIVRRDGLDDSRLKLRLPLLSLTRAPASLTLVSPSSLLVGLELFVFGLILLAGVRRLGHGRPRVDFLAHIGAGAALVLSLVAVLNAFNAGENSVLALRNPFPSDSASLVRGQTLYQANCAACHGTTGAGDGPVGVALRPPPANLQLHMNDGHPDGLLFDWISNGIKGSAMPAFGGRMSEQARWEIITFLRTLTKPR